MATYRAYYHSYYHALSCTYYQSHTSPFRLTIQIPIQPSTLTPVPYISDFLGVSVLIEIRYSIFHLPFCFAGPVAIVTGRFSVVFIARFCTLHQTENRVPLSLRFRFHFPRDSGARVLKSPVSLVRLIAFSHAPEQSPQ